MKQTQDLTVLIIDEHPGVSHMLARALRRVGGIRVIGETSNVMLGAELAHQLEPAVIVADFRRTGVPRNETYRWLGRVCPTAKIVAHTSYIANGEERALREAGVAKYCLKGRSVEALAEELLSLAPAGSATDTRNGAG